MEALGLEPRRGGNWFTGYHRHGDEWFLFPTIGESGRTGHDYHNRWLNGSLEWYAKNGIRIHTNAIQTMLAPGATVHLFARSHNREPFTYHGLASPLEVFDEPTARIIWSVGEAGVELMPGELEHGDTVTEGGKTQVIVNSYERDRSARFRCIAHWGASCQICGMSFATRYGELGEGFIHVHHLRPIASVGEEYELNPIDDLRPVCANCHAMLHREDPPLTIERLRELVQHHEA